MDATLLTADRPSDLSGLVEEVEDVDLVLLFPGFEADADAVADAAREVSAPVAGASVGAVATHDTAGFERDGLAAVAFSDVDVEVDVVEDVWEADVDDLRSRLRGDGATIVAGGGVRAAPSDAVSSNIRRMAGRVIRKDTLGQRDRVLRNVRKILRSSAFGYSPLFRAWGAEMLDGNSLVGYATSDLGDLTDGFELVGGEVSEIERAAILRTDATLTYGQSRSAIGALNSDRVVESFSDLGVDGRLIYSFGGKSMSDLHEEHGAGGEIGRGAFSHYLIVEDQGTSFSMALTQDLDLVVSYVPLSDDATAHLIEAPEFDEFRDAFRSMTDDFMSTGLHQVSLNPTRYQLYGDRLFDLVDDAEEHLDEYLLTVDNAFRDNRAIDTMTWPSYVKF